MEWINVILSSKQAPCFLKTLRTSLDAPTNTSWYYYALLVMLFFESIRLVFSILNLLSFIFSKINQVILKNIHINRLEISSLVDYCN